MNIFYKKISKKSKNYSRLVVLALATVIVTGAAWVGATGPANPPSDNSIAPITVFGGEKVGALGVGGGIPEPEVITISSIPFTISPINLSVMAAGNNIDGSIGFNEGLSAAALFISPLYPYSPALRVGLNAAQGGIEYISKAVVNKKLSVADHILVRNLADQASTDPRNVCATENGYLVPCEEVAPISGCTDVNADNYNSVAEVDDGSCVTTFVAIVLGCTNSSAINYNPSATAGNADSDECTFQAITYNPSFNVTSTYTGGSELESNCSQTNYSFDINLGPTDPSHTWVVTYDVDTLSGNNEVNNQVISNINTFAQTLQRHGCDETYTYTFTATNQTTGDTLTDTLNIIVEDLEGYFIQNDLDVASPDGMSVAQACFFYDPVWEGTEGNQTVLLTDSPACTPYQGGGGSDPIEPDNPGVKAPFGLENQVGSDPE